MTLKIDTSACGDSDNYIKYLEHVQAKITLSYSRRGDLQIHLVSPNGTRSTLLPRRKNDYQSGEFKDWPFMSVFFWGEQAVGTWKLEIENTGSRLNTGYFEKWQLIMYGTDRPPVHLKPPPSQAPSKSPKSHENPLSDKQNHGNQGDKPYPEYESPLPEYEIEYESPGMEYEMGEEGERGEGGAGGEEGGDPEGSDSGWFTEIYSDPDKVVSLTITCVFVFFYRTQTLSINR